MSFTNKKTIAILGAAGTQGSSLVRALCADWTIRAMTRDPLSPRAQALLSLSPSISLFQADAGNASSLRVAFRGVTAIYAVTDYWAPFFDAGMRAAHYIGPDPGETLRKHAFEMEVQHGKNIIDTAAYELARSSSSGGSEEEERLEHLIWSALPSCSEASGGAYQGIYHFESKAVVTRYLETAYPALAARTGVLLMTFYASNMLTFKGMWPARLADGSFVVEQLCSRDAPLPFIVPADMGVLAKALLNRRIQERAEGKTPTTATLLAYSAMASWGDMMRFWAETTGKTEVTRFRQVTAGEYEAMYPGVGEEIKSAPYAAEFGYAGPRQGRGGRDNFIEPADLGFVPDQRRVERWFQSQDWRAVLEAEPRA